MLCLRPYKKCDAEHIVKWLTDETVFWKWCAGRYDHYPITAQDMNRHYEQFEFVDNFYEMTAFDDTDIVGHMIMRFTDEEKKVLRFGFVIVDDSKRGKGYGRKMLSLALQYAFEILKAEKVTIGVFENNASARACYRSLGFQEVPLETPEYFELMNEKWNCLEMEILSKDRKC